MQHSYQTPNFDSNQYFHDVANGNGDDDWKEVPFETLCATLSDLSPTILASG